jgi:integral membrane protein
VEAAVTRYRAAAYVVGVLLLMLAVGMVLKYGFDRAETFTANVAQIHGIFYVGYFVTCYDLWRRTGWPLPRMALMALAGVLPGLTFFVERKIVAAAKAAVKA